MSTTARRGGTSPGVFAGAGARPSDNRCPGAAEDAAHVSAQAIAALEGLVASLGPAHVGDCAAILSAGLHAGAAADHAAEQHADRQAGGHGLAA